MSVEALALVLHHSRASGTPKVVLLGIANHDGDGGAWPSIETLAKYARVAERNVQRAISASVKAGELAVEANAGGNGSTDPRYRPNRYTILVTCPLECDGTTNHRMRGDECAAPEARGVTNLAARGDDPDRPGVTQATPEPSLEPPKNPPAATAAPSPRARTDPRADAIVREWWERQTPRPMQNFMAVRGIVSKALTAGHGPGHIAQALTLTEGDPPLVAWKLEKALARLRGKRHDPRGLNADRNDP